MSFFRQDPTADDKIEINVSQTLSMSTIPRMLPGCAKNPASYHRTESPNLTMKWEIESIVLVKTNCSGWGDYLNFGYGIYGLHSDLSVSSNKK